MNIDQSGRRLRVVVPDIVMDRLEIPQQLSAGSVCRDNGRAEQVVSRPVCADAVVVGSSEGHVEDASLLIDGHISPDIHAGTLLPTVAAPGVVACFSRAGHRVESPHQFSGMYIPGP